MEQEKKICFVIMPISDADGYEKGHFTRVYEHLIKPAIEQAGFKPDRADDTSKANYIVVDILQKILACDIVVCDLSSRNPNVFYELGIRQAFNKKTVLIKDGKTVMPFDISGIRTLSYSENLRIDEVKKDIPNIAKCINETYEADAKEVNSLLQLLSIEKPASLPEKVTLSQDSNLILGAIENLNKRIDSIIPANRFVEYSKNTNKGKTIILPNGVTAEIGADIYINGNWETPLGKLAGETDKHILIRNENKQLTGITKNSEKGMSLTDLPF
jgi:hypothetical protein